MFENVELGALGAGLGRRKARERTWNLLEGLRLQHLARMYASSLPHGEERRVGIARAVACAPKFLLLDEPAAGLNDAESDALAQTIVRIRDENGCGVLLVEHDMRVIFGVCQQIQVLDYGKSVAFGTPRRSARTARSSRPIWAKRERTRLLNLTDVWVHYGRVAAVQGLNLTVEQGELVGLVGNNGAGKTTTLSTISGVRRPSKGEIVFEGKRIDGSAPDKVLRRGVSLVPENRRIFQRLSVAENLQIGTSGCRDRPEAKRDIDQMYERFPVLARYRRHPGANLSGGEQQQLAIARALLSRPRLLLLDEPTLGLAPLMVDRSSTCSGS